MNNMKTTSSNFAVVTGGSSGIGYELARQFLENGYDVLIAAEDDGIKTAAQQLRTFGGDVQAVQADLATHAGNQELYKAIQAAGRPVDALALNAGVGVGGPFVESEMDALMNMIDVNVMAPVHLARLLVPDMVRRNAGRILITSSIAATMPTPFETVYGATKVFLLSFADGLRSELKDTEITVTALMPGATETNFFHRAGLDDTKIGQAKKDDPAAVAKDGFDALMKGDHHIISHSFKSKMQGMLGEFLPEAVSAQMHRKQSEPRSASK